MDSAGNVFAPLSPSVIIWNNDIPIRIYSITQTRPINQPGGVNAGLFKVIYHVVNFYVVNKDPTMPTASQITIADSCFNPENIFSIY